MGWGLLLQIYWLRLKRLRRTKCLFEPTIFEPPASCGISLKNAPQRTTGQRQPIRSPNRPLSIDCRSRRSGETEDCVSVLLDVPEGQQTDFHFIQGQYLTFKKTIGGEEVRRSYSLCSSPLDGELRVAIKEVEGGRFSTYANRELQAGDELESMTPRGSFHVPLGTEAGSHYVAFASGSGITPVMSILRTTLKQEPDSHFHLFYGNRNSQSVIFREMLDDLKNEFMGRLEVHHILSREDQGSDLLKGRLDAEKCMAFGKTFFDPAGIRAYFLCGPGEMIENIQAPCKTWAWQKKRIHFELFSAPTAKKPVSEKKKSSWTKN